jgi:hypothetical protein
VLNPPIKKENEPENILKLQQLEREVARIMEKNALPKIMNPPLSQNERDIYEYDTGSNFIFHKQGRREISFYATNKYICHGLQFQ